MINQITRGFVSLLPRTDVRAWATTAGRSLFERSSRVLRSNTEQCRRLVRRHRGWLWLALPIALAVFEVRTSSLQSIVFSSLASRLSYAPDHGPSASIVFPASGPADERNGYTRLPEITRRLEDRGYRLTAQARFSPVLMTLARWGIPPPFREGQAGLVMRDRAGRVSYAAQHKDQRFPSYDDIPPLMVRSLLFMEDRDLGDERDPRLNPAVDWGRLAKASALYAGSKLGLPGRIEGGSTLAVQMVKYRHGDDGETRSPLDKLRQIAAASLEAYRTGPDTRDARRGIVLDYLNSCLLYTSPSPRDS